MKIITTLFLTLLMAVPVFGQISTNGVYVQNGITTEVEKKVYEITPTNKSEVLYFSNELIVKVYTNSNFTINSFFQDVINTNNTPEKSKFGSHNLSATLMDGGAVVVYSGGDSNSSCVISTPIVDIELFKGTFYFRVNENRVFVFVLEGSLKSHGERNSENVVTKGYAVIAVPNDFGVLEAKISLGSEKVQQALIEKLTNESKDVVNLKDSIMFIRINGKTVGVSL